MLNDGDKVKLTIYGTWNKGEITTQHNTWFKLYSLSDPAVSVEKVEDNA